MFLVHLKCEFTNFALFNNIFLDVEVLYGLKVYPDGYLEYHPNLVIHMSIYVTICRISSVQLTLVPSITNNVTSSFQDIGTTPISMT